MDLKKKKDYSKGRYIVKDTSGAQIGRLEDSEHVTGLNGMPLYRVDGDEFYTAAKLEGATTFFLGYIKNGKARCAKDRSHIYFTIVEDKE